MRRAGAFLIAAVAILAGVLLVTGGRVLILPTGIVGIVSGLAFAAWPEEGMRVVGFVVCIPIVILQLVVGIPSGILWLAVCAAAVFAPPAVGLVVFAFILMRDFEFEGDDLAVLFLEGDGLSVLFLIGFITLWIACREAHRTLIRETANATGNLILSPNMEIDEFREKTFAYFEGVGRWMTE
jgi:hypothetical protein